MLPLVISQHGWLEVLVDNALTMSEKQNLVVIFVMISVLHTSQQRSVHTPSQLQMKCRRVPALVRWYQTSKTKPNFTSLAESGKRLTAGKKTKRKAASKKATNYEHDIVSNADESDYTQRATTNDPPEGATPS